LRSVNQSLARRAYRTALLTLRSNRINLNLIVDHNPNDFYKHAADFVNDVDDPDLLNLFLTALSDEDCIPKEFPLYRPLPPAPDLSEHEEQKRKQDKLQRESLAVMAGLKASDDSKAVHPKDNRRRFNQLVVDDEEAAPAVDPHEGKSKLNRVCDVLCDVLNRDKAQHERRLLSVLTALAVKSPPDLEAALEVIRGIRDRERSGVAAVLPPARPGAKPARPVTSDAALKYVIFLSDVSRLLDAALGLYDFDLTMLVAQYSQLDPKQYIPVINKLKQLSDKPLFQRYSIDLHLKRHDKALRNLAKAVTQPALQAEERERYADLLVDLVRQHKLHVLALQLFAPSAVASSPGSSLLSLSSALKRYQRIEQDADPLVALWRRLLSLYGAHLASLAQDKQAAVVYELSGDFERALTSYKKAGDYRAALSLCGRLGMSEERQTAVVNELVGVLRGENEFVAAARLSVDYAHNLEQAVLILLQAEEFEECLRLLYLHQREDLIETNFLPSLLKSYERHLSRLQSERKAYAYSTSRLRVVRKAKLLVPRQQHELADARDVELESIVTGTRGFSSSQSVVSGMTGLSGVSAYSTYSSYSSFSNASSLQSNASTSSIFSVSKERKRELTKDERKIAKAHDRTRRKQANKSKIKEGHALEENQLVSEVRRLRPSDKYKQQVLDVTRTLLRVGLHERARLLQEALESFISLVEEQERLPMPLLPDGTSEQNAAIAKHWDWPQSCYEKPGRSALDDMKDMSSFLHFLNPDPQALEGKAEPKSQAPTSASSSSPSGFTSVLSSSGAPSAAIMEENEDDLDDDGAIGGMFAD